MTDRLPPSTACSRRLSWLGAIAAWVLAVFPASADTVSLVNGRTFEGQVSFDAKEGLIVVPKGLPSQRVEIRDLLSLKIDAKAPPSPPRRMVTLVSGAQLAGSELLLLNDREMRLKRTDNTIFSTSAAVVSRVNFRPAEEFKVEPSPEVVGVVTVAGDTAEGDVVSIDEKEVVVSSVLFGLQKFETAKQVHAVLLRPAGVSMAAYIVRTADGSEIHAADLRVDRGKLQINTDVGGQVQVDGSEVRTIELGPASADGMGAVAGMSGNGSLPLEAGSSTDMALGGRYRAMELQLSVPDIYVPNRAMTFTLLADGKEIGKAGPLTSVDPPATITRTIEGVKTLTIRSEATGPEAIGVAGQVGAGRFIRAQ